jgi:hypothetical protein
VSNSLLACLFFFHCSNLSLPLHTSESEYPSLALFSFFHYSNLFLPLYSPVCGCSNTHSLAVLICPSLYALQLVRAPYLPALSLCLLVSPLCSLVCKCSSLAHFVFLFSFAPISVFSRKWVALMPLLCCTVLTYPPLHSSVCK